MAIKPSEGHVEWIADDDTDKYIAPSAAKKLQGWIKEEKPPFQYFNWFFRLVDRWLQWAEARSDENAAAIAVNAQAITAEAATRSDADTTLQSNIDAEASARAVADGTLQSNINTEATTRAGADSTLQNNINAISNRIGGSGTDDIPTNGSTASFSGKSFSQDGDILIVDTGNTSVESPLRIYTPNLQDSGQCQLFLGCDGNINNAAVFAFYKTSDGSALNETRIGIQGIYILQLDGSGNVGICKTSQGAKLDVAGYGDFNSIVRIGNNHASHIADIGNGAGNVHIDGRSGLGGSGGSVYFNYNNGEGGICIGNGAGSVVATIDGSGKVTFTGGINDGASDLSAPFAMIDAICDSFATRVNSYETSSIAIGGILNTVDLGTVTEGDVFIATAQAEFNTSGSDGTVEILLSKYSGTATVAGIGSSNPTFQQGCYVPTIALNIGVSVTGVFRVTGSGTLTMQSEGALNHGSSATAVQRKLEVVWLKKQ